MVNKADIISGLRKDILALQGCKAPLYTTDTDVKLGPIRSAFPNKTFPIIAVHEFICSGPETLAATKGFITAILSFLIKSHKPIIWISKNRMVFPPALQRFGVAPHQFIFIEAKREKDLLWTLEESLRCDAVSAVIAETKEISFTASRRLQLAVEESHVTGFVIRDEPRNLSTVCDARWQINSLPSETADDLPGIGFPKWNVELLKVRNGKTGSWAVTWKNDRFQFFNNFLQLVTDQKRKTG